MLSLALIRNAMTKAITSITGVRKIMRMHIWNVICKVATSEVRRVTIEEVENLSILEKS